MPAPYRKKDSILEMSDREREARRLAELARPGRDALEGVYPEMFVNPASIGRTAAGIGKIIDSKILPQKTLQNLPKIEIGSKVRPSDTELYVDRLFGELKKESKYKNASEAELAQIKQRMLQHYGQYDLKKVRQREAQKAAQEFKNKQSAAKFSAYRRAGAEYGARAFDESENPSEQEYKKGGAVKAKKHRGDGIAQRGKTRGRMI